MLERPCQPCCEECKKVKLYPEDQLGGCNGHCYRLTVCCPKIHVLKPNPQSDDGIWRRVMRVEPL